MTPAEADDLLESTLSGEGENASARSRAGRARTPRIASAHAEAEAAPGDDASDGWTEDALALRFTAAHGDDLRYIAQWHRWLQWVGHRWVEDTTLHVYDRARAICREIASTCDKSARRSAMLNDKTFAGVERIARADRQHAATVQQFDADPLLLATPGGVVDLRTGAVRAARREDYCTRSTSVPPGGSRSRWQDFLRFVTGGDSELEGFLQRWCGYCLTGHTKEEKLVFGYGSGANGKSTFVGAIQAALGDYATTAPMDVFIASRGDRHPTEVAYLRGARLVTAQETEEGRSWNAARIKALTGGDRITARYMRQDFFQFDPTFKLFLFGNHRPHLRTVDAALRRRFLLVPFEQRVPIIDPEFKSALLSETGGVLEWAIEGCLEWLERGGLFPPAVVMAATEQYFAAEDDVEAWLSECCEVTPRGDRDRRDAPWASSKELFESWTSFCAREHIEPGTKKSLTTTLESRGFPLKTGGAKQNQRGLAGIVALLPMEASRARIL